MSHNQIACILVCASAFCAPGLVSAQSPPKGPSPIRVVETVEEALVAPAVEVIAFVDSTTGLRRDPTQAELIQLRDAARALPFKGGYPQVVRVQLKNGVEVVPVPPEFDRELSVRFNEAGRLQVEEMQRLEAD